MDEHTVVNALAALAQPVRLKVFRALVMTGQAGLTPSAMAEGLGIPPNTLSFHLKELAHADLVSVEREGRQLFYRPNLVHMNDLLSYLVDHCCQGQSCAPKAKRAKACATPASC